VAGIISTSCSFARMFGNYVYYHGAFEQPSGLQMVLSLAAANAVCWVGLAIARDAIN